MGTYSYTGTVQSFTVQQSGIYDIVAYGAQGGIGRFEANPGRGAETGGYFALTAGEKLKIVVGGAGSITSGSGAAGGGGGGGGGSFVLGSTDGGATYSLLLASGGGGGGGAGGSGHGGYSASSSPGTGTGGAGGGFTDGNGGGGAGFKAAGQPGINGESGSGGTGYSGGGGQGNGVGGKGGFGGGGGGGVGGGGGGGGYSGGRGGSGADGGNAGGGGGTSKDNGTPIAAQTLAAARTGNGSVVLLHAVSIALADDTGASNSDGVTRDDTVRGTAAAGATVTFTDGNTTLGSTTADATTGAYTFNPAASGHANIGQGAQTITATETLGGISDAASVELTYDTAQPTVAAVSDSGPGIDGRGNGDLGAGRTVTLTVTTSEPVYVQGGAPTLALNDGGVAAYTGGSGTAQITFSYTVAAGQNTSALSVAQVNANGATVTDAAGNPIGTSLAGASVPSGTLAIDTTAPTASSPTDTAAQNGGPTPIGITVGDNLTPTASLAATIGSLPADGTVTLSDGRTAVTAGESLTGAQLEGLEFTPTGVAGQSSTLTYTVADGAGNAAQGTATLNVGAPNAPPDAVSIAPQVTYADGVFTLAGTASSTAGARSVEISAVVDGTRQDLGAATVNANGTFSFSDLVGDQQSFIQATLTDGAGVRTVSGDPGFNLTGGLGPNGKTGKEESFSSAAQVSTALFRPNGQRFLSVEAPGQTLDLQPYDIVSNNRQGGTTFVFSPGDGLDVVHGFKVGGADHDTVALPSADFRNFAAVLRDTGDVNGSAFVTDPKTGEGISLPGVTTAELKAHPKDFTFSA